MLAESTILSLPREVSVPLQCARIHLGTWEVTALRGHLQTEDCNWDLVLAAARWHRLDPIMYRVLNEHAADLVPRKVMDELTAFCSLNAKRHLFLTTWLIRLMDLLQSKGIPALCMKGIPLATMLYDNPSLRPSQDLDILVSHKDLKQVLTLMEEQGFHNTRAPKRPIPVDLLHKVDYQVDLANEHVAVDLHWYCGRYPELFPRKEGDFFAKATCVSIAGKQIPIFEADQMMLYLAFHGSKHLWMRWFWLMDIAGLMDRVDDWHSMIEKAKRMGQLHSLLLTFLMVHTVFGKEMPKPLELWLPKLPRTLNKLIQYHIDASWQGSVDGFEIPVSRWSKTTWTMKLQPNSWRAFKVFARFFLQPGTEDMMALSLPKPLFPLYSIFRPFRILAKELFGR